MSTTTRGVCADAARAALKSETLGAAVYAMCPPAVVRGTQLHELANEYQGSAAWSCRSRPQRQHLCRVRRYARRGYPADVAETADTSMLLYEVLTRSDDPDVRRAAASNPGCSEATIRRFVADDDPDVRTEAAANPACGSETLSEFARRPDAWDLKLGVAKNPSASWQTLEMLVCTATPLSMRRSRPTRRLRVGCWRISPRTATTKFVRMCDGTRHVQSTSKQSWTQASAMETDEFPQQPQPRRWGRAFT